MHRNEKSTRPNPVCRIIVRLCVIVCLWQGPVPWFHCHDSELVALASPSSIVELRHHLATFHDHTALDQDHEFGWHFHWILPGWSDGFHELPRDEVPVSGFAALDLNVFCATTSGPVDRLFDSDLFQYFSGRKFTGNCQQFWRIDRHNPSQKRHEFPLVMRC